MDNQQLHLTLCIHIPIYPTAKISNNIREIEFTCGSVFEIAFYKLEDGIHAISRFQIEDCSSILAHSELVWGLLQIFPHLQAQITRAIQ